MVIMILLQPKVPSSIWWWSSRPVWWSNHQQGGNETEICIWPHDPTHLALPPRPGLPTWHSIVKWQFHDNFVLNTKRKALNHSQSWPFMTFLLILYCIYLCMGQFMLTQFLFSGYRLDLQYNGRTKSRTIWWQADLNMGCKGKHLNKAVWS